MIDMFIQLESCLRVFALFSLKILSIICLCSSFCTDSFSQNASVIKSAVRSSAKPSTITAQPPAVSITVFDTEQGLALSSVLTSLKDTKGNLWFGTLGGGVSKYDGLAFQNYGAHQGLADNLVMSILEDRKGNLWFGTFGGGVSVFDGISFRTFTAQDGLASNRVTATFEDSAGQFWFGTLDGGVIRYNGKTFKTFAAEEGLANDSVWSIAEDDTGLLYFATDNGVFVHDGKSFTPMSVLKKKSVRCILFDAKRNLWAGTIGDGAFKISSVGAKQYTTANGLPDNSISNITQDRLGTLWFGTESGGVASFNGVQFQTLTTREGLSNNHVTSVVEDNYGSIWISTFGGGVNRFHGRAVQAYDRRHGLPSSKIRSVIEDSDGNLWIGTFGGGVSKFDGQKFLNYDTARGLPSNQVRTILQSRDGTFWIGMHGGGLSRLNQAAFTNYNVSSGLANNTVRTLYEDADGKLWIGTDDGLSIWDGKKFKTLRQRDGLPHAMVWDVLQDSKGNYWMGTYGGGLTFYDGKSFRTYTTADGLNSNFILCLLQDSNGNIWIGGTSGGLTRFDGNSFITLKKSDGLPDETVYDILESPSGELWVGTNLGLTKVSFISPNNAIVSGSQLAVANSLLMKNFRPRFDVYNTITGYGIKDVNTNAMCITRVGYQKGKEKNGMLWAGCGDDRLIQFDPMAIRSGTTPPNVIVRNVKVNDQSLSWYGLLDDGLTDSAALAQQQMLVYGRHLPEEEQSTLTRSVSDVRVSNVIKFSNVPDGLVVPYSLNRLTFEFNAIETSRYPLINYQYMLEGQDDRWSPVVKMSQATYSNLWEGDYIFKVRAQSAEGIWGDPVLYRFSVLPPWWRHQWMYVLYIAAFLSLFAIVIKVRSRKLTKEKELLEQIVEERTNEVVQQMKIVEAQKNEAQQQRIEAERQRQLVEKKNTEIMEQLTRTEASLSSLTLEMIERFHAYTELEQELKRLAENGDPNKFKRVFSLITTNKSLDREWEQFNLFFDGIYKDFHNKLRGRVQQLSNYDLRLCALIKMGFENQEIAMLLNIEVTSVKMAKYRLRKKFQIEDPVDLQEYFEML